MDKDINIGIIIKNIRVENGYSQEELGKKINLAHNTISSYERGNSQPDFRTIIKILNYCKYEILIKDKENNIYSLKKLSKEKY